MDSTIPSGTVTLLFTDIEGSTKLWEAHPELMRVSLARHDVLLREAIVGANGHVFKTAGDAFCAAFASAPDAVAAALAIQLALHHEKWPDETPIKVRIGLHTGAVESRDRDYFGPPVNRVARLQSTGHGGQTLLSQATCELSRDALPEAASLRDLGAHRLQDLARPEHVYELQHPDLPADFPPIKSLSTHPNNLPPQLTSFIGREREIAEVDALREHNRLLTLTGSGGSGKTRLGLQVAAEALPKFPDGAWLVELAPLTDAGLVPQTVAKVLGTSEEPGKSIAETLIEQLKGKRLLLMLDNCEHLLDACAKLADAIVTRCPGVQILATSREALGVKGEQTYRVPSLPLPDRALARIHTPQSLSTCASAQLFIDRALRVRAEFEVTNQNAPAVASLCCHLDGIPLAIELAAARVRTLTVEEIDGRLDQLFHLLTRGSRTAMPRQQTLRALIDWSYDLLSDAEQKLLWRLSVFAGGWTLAAAEQVGAGDDVATRDVFELLTSLCDKSLVSAEQSDGISRYQMLETVRQYAREKLFDSGGSEHFRKRHRDFFLALAEEAEPKLTGAEQALWLQLLEADHENLRAALDWSTEEAATAGGLRLCGVLQRFWWTRGHFAEGREWCSRVLAKAGGDDLSPEHAKVLNVAGGLAYLQGDYPAARARHQESLAIRRRLDDRSGIAASLGNLGVVALAQGDLASARALHEESLSIRRTLGDHADIARALNNVGVATYLQGDYSAARAIYQEGLAIMRELGDQSVIANFLNNLGNAALDQDDFPAAHAQFEESLAIGRRLGDRYGIAYALDCLANVAFEQGSYPAAQELAEESLAIRRDLGDRSGIADSLEAMAVVIATLGSFLRGARIWGAAERMRAQIGSPLAPDERPRYDRRVARARAASGDDVAFDRAWQEGRALTLEQAIEVALQHATARP